MLLMGVSGVAISGALLVSRPVTDQIVAQGKNVVAFQKSAAVIRSASYKYCTSDNVASTDSLYPISDDDKNTSVETSILIGSTWVPCTKKLWQTNSYQGTDYTSWMSYISTAPVQKVTLTKKRSKGDPLVLVIAKFNQ